MGFDAKILRKVISIRKQDADERAEQEAILDTYLHALGMIQLNIFEEPETSPKLVATVATAMQTQAGRAALLTAVDIMIEREERFDAETGEILDDIEASAGTAPAVETSLAARGAEESAVSNSEIATASQGGTASPSPDAELSSAGANAGGEDVDRSAERANINAVASASGPDEKRATEIQANPEEAGAHGETESVPAVDAGSRPVVGRSTTATSEDGRDSLERQAPSSTAKPKYVLRPHCLKPGETCGGYSDKHCHACTVAMRKREQAEEVA